MATAKQKLGEFGETVVTKHCSCPKCKRQKTLKRLPTNFKCADLVCDFCGYLAQVKASTASNNLPIPKKVLGAAWGPQKDRMDSGIFFPLFLVLKAKSKTDFSIYYLSADLQNLDLFEPRKPLSKSARRAGWQGFYYNMEAAKHGLVCVYKSAIS